MPTGDELTEKYNHHNNNDKISYDLLSALLVEIISNHHKNPTRLRPVTSFDRRENGS